MTGDKFFCENTDRTFTFGSTRVLLIAGSYDGSEKDPVSGSDWECEGLVTKLSPNEEYILWVKWDNGCINEYRSHDLDIVGHIDIMAADNPNRSFRLKKLEKRNEDLDRRSAELEERTAELERSVDKWFGKDKARRDKAKGDFDKIKQVMDSTGSGVQEAKKALEDTDGDVDEAIGLAKFRQAGREAVRNSRYAVEADFELIPASSYKEPEVRKIMGSTGMSIIEATKALQKYEGDVDAVITYYNLYGKLPKASGEGEQDVTEEEAAIATTFNTFSELSEKTATGGIVPPLEGKPSSAWSRIKKKLNVGEE